MTVQTENDRVQAALNGYFRGFNAPRLLEQFHQPGLTHEPSVLINFLSTRIPVEVNPEILTLRAGRLEGKPNPGNWDADVAEWTAALRSVVMSQDRYRIVELSCGWGCWMTNMGVAVRRRGLGLELIGIERDAGGLLELARWTLALNGFAEGDDVWLHHAVATQESGKVAYWAGTRPGQDGQFMLCSCPEALAAVEADDARQVLDCLTPPQLCDGRRIADIQMWANCGSNKEEGST